MLFGVLAVSGLAESLLSHHLASLSLVVCICWPIHTLSQATRSSTGQYRAQAEDTQVLGAIAVSGLAIPLHRQSHTQAQTSTKHSQV